MWYLFGAWLLAATMNAALTWWGVSMAIASHNVQSASVIDPKLLYTIVPVFVALMVWVIRILIIGSLSVAGEKMLNSFRQPTQIRTPQTNSHRNQRTQQPIRSTNTVRTNQPAYTTRQASPKHINNTVEPRPFAKTVEPTYHSFNNRQNNNQNRNM